MALLLRRGLEANRLSFIPEEGELIYVTDTKLIYVGDGVTPGGILVAGGVAPPTPTYALSTDNTTVNEGDVVTITLTTTNITNGTTIGYTIAGSNITAGDLGLGSLNGIFLVTNNTSSLVLNIANDFLTEGSETFTLSLNSITPAVTISITITDTSTDVIDGGGPTSTFTSVVDGGGPTTVFTEVIDGGTP